jgi:hypothetical protein
MSVPATQSIPPASEAPDDLDQLVKAGLRLVHLLERHVEAAVQIAEAHVASDPVDLFPPRPLPNYPADIGLTFSRIARAMRLTKALQVRLARTPRDQPDPPGAAGSGTARYRLDLHDPDGDSIEPSDATLRLDHDGWERLEDEDTDGDILSRPVPEILAVIRGDLGLASGDLQAPDKSPPRPEDVGVARGVRGPTLQGQAVPPIARRETTNHTNAIRRPP